MRVYGGTMRRVMAALVLTLLTAGACGGGSDESRGRRFPTRASDDTTTTAVPGPEVEGIQVTTSVPVVPVTPSLQVPPATASLPGSGSRGPWPRRGFGCRRVPYPKCSQTARRPCCRPGDPANARFHARGAGS
jgi:hypothetical protein